jgi:uncharacterized membrane protein
VRWRGESASRLEGFSDAVFGFALTLLVISLEVPKTAAELIKTFQGVPAFGVSFLLLFSIWWHHCKFFRRYGLQDRLTVLLNGLVLFVVLVYVYPLKFLFALSFRPFFEHGAAAPTPGEVRWLISLYAGGFGTIFGLFALLTFHAYRLRDSLALTPAETFETLYTARRYLFIALPALLTVVLAYLLPARQVYWANLSFFSISVTNLLNRRWARKRRPPDTVPERTMSEGMS